MPILCSPHYTARFSEVCVKIGVSAIQTMQSLQRTKFTLRLHGPFNRYANMATRVKAGVRVKADE